MAYILSIALDYWIYITASILQYLVDKIDCYVNFLSEYFLSKRSLNLSLILFVI